jgi:hypothetical protein
LGAGVELGVEFWGAGNAPRLGSQAVLMRLLFMAPLLLAERCTGVQFCILPAALPLLALPLLPAPAAWPALEPAAPCAQTGVETASGMTAAKAAVRKIPTFMHVLPDNAEGNVAASLGLRRRPVNSLKHQ